MPPHDQPQRRRIEREFGVPFPGVIADEQSWTSTAIKTLPVVKPFAWREMFGRDAPIVVDVGCGNGRFLIGSAVWRPDHDHLGVDILPLVIRYATRRANQRALGNIRFAVIGGRELLEQYISPHSVSEIHCYHPQPYANREEHHLRLLTPQFLALVHRSLVAGGKFYLQTDNPGYWRYMCATVPHFFEFEERSACWPDAPRGRTRREIIALKHGLPVYRGMGIAKPNLAPDAAIALADQLPSPIFAATRSAAELDKLERE